MAENRGQHLGHEGGLRPTASKKWGSQVYFHKEMNSAGDIYELRSSVFLVEHPEENVVRVAPGLQPCEPLSGGTS